MSSSTAPQPTVADRHRAALESFDAHVNLQLKRTLGQVRIMDLATSLMKIAIRLVMIVIAVSLVDHWAFSLPTWGRWATLLVLGAVLLHGLLLRVLPLLIWRINPLYAAQQIEQSMPSLKNGLINYVLLRGRPQQVHLSVLGALGQTTATQLNQEPDQQFVDHRSLLRTGYMLILVFGCFAAYLILSPKNPLQTLQRILTPWGDISRPSRVEILEVKPGTQDVYFSESLEITAHLRGVTQRDQILLEYSSLDGQLVDQQLPLQQTEQSSWYRVQLPPGEEGIQQDLVYRITAGDAISSDYELTVIPAPTIVVQRVEYEYPGYTGLPPRVFTDRADISAIEGTRVTIHGRANQVIRSASLDLYSSEGTRPLSRGLDIDGLKTRGNLLLALDDDRRTQTFNGYELQFINDQGHPSETPIRHRIEITRDLPPEIELLAPLAPEVEVPLDGSLRVEVRAIDPDFGLSRVLVKDDRQLFKTPLLDDPEGMDGQFLHQFVMQPAKLGLKPGDTLTFHLVAEDNRQTGFNEAAPNISETRAVRILVTEPENPAASTEQSNNDQEKPESGDPDSENPEPTDDAEKGSDGEKGTDDAEKGSDGEKSGGQEGQGQKGDPHDGDVFQRALDRIKKERLEKSKGNGSDDGSKTNESQDSSDSNTGSEEGEKSEDGTGDDSRKPAEEEQPGSDSGDGGGTGEKVEGPMKPSGSADKGSSPTDRQQKPGAGKDSEGRPANGEKPTNPGDDAGTGTGKPGEEKGSEPGDAPKGNNPNDNKPGDNDKPAEDTGDEQGTGSKPGDGSEKPTDEPGKGDPSSKSSSKGSEGEKPAAQQAGESEGEKGNSPSGEKSPDGSATNGGASGQSDSNASGNNSPGKSSGNPSGIGDSGRKQNSRGVGPDESEEIPNEVVGLPDEIPESDEAQLDYARKVTNLVLEYLEDQQFNPDPDLLKETGLTPEQLREMVERYKQMARKAEQGEEGRRELEETLRSLGLHPRSNRQASRVRSETRQIEGISNAGTRSQPPPRFLEQFNAFKKGTARSDK